jgi:hypothetical protein
MRFIRFSLLPRRFSGISAPTVPAGSQGRQARSHAGRELGPSNGDESEFSYDTPSDTMPDRHTPEPDVDNQSCRYFLALQARRRLASTLRMRSAHHGSRSDVERIAPHASAPISIGIHPTQKTLLTGHGVFSAL